MDPQLEPLEWMCFAVLQVPYLYIYFIYVICIYIKSLISQESQDTFDFTILSLKDISESDGFLQEWVMVLWLS